MFWECLEIVPHLSQIKLLHLVFYWLGWLVGWLADWLVGLVLGWFDERIGKKERKLISTCVRGRQRRMEKKKHEKMS